MRWADLVALAVEENLSGLAWHHLHDFTSLPAGTRDELTGLRLRQRALIRVQEETIARLLDVAGRLGVEVMLLKGAALRRQVYPDPEMRVMRDIDVLTPEADGRRLYDALVDAGFAAIDSGTHPIHHPVLAWQQGLFGVGVEIHWVAHRRWPMRFEDLAPRGSRIDVMGRPVWVPSLTDLLRHVFMHAFGSDVWLGSRLVAVADLVAILETRSPALDPGLLRRRDRALVRALSWLTLFAPLSDEALVRVGRVGRSSGIGESYTGWPLETGARPLRSWRHFRATFAPSPWWLRLRYWARPGILPLAWAWVRHVYDLFWVWW